MQTSCSSLFVSNHQFRICISFSQSLLASNVQTPGWRVVPFIALRVNVGLGGGRLKPANAPCVCLSNTAHKSLFCTFPSLSVWLTCKAKLLALEIMITNDLGFSEGLVQLMDIPVGPGCSESMAVPDGRGLRCGVTCVVKSLLTQEGECCCYSRGNKEVYGGC